MVNIPHEFREILLTHLPFANSADFSESDELASLGLDSMGVVQLLGDIEAEFGVEIPDELLDEQTFATVGSLWQAVSTLPVATERAS